MTMELTPYLIFPAGIQFFQMKSLFSLVAYPWVATKSLKKDLSLHQQTRMRLKIQLISDSYGTIRVLMLMNRSQSGNPFAQIATRLLVFYVKTVDVDLNSLPSNAYMTFMCGHV